MYHPDKYIHNKAPNHFCELFKDDEGRLGDLIHMKTSVKENDKAFTENCFNASCFEV